MRIVTDHAVVPPRTVLEESSAFDSLSIELRVPPHAWIHRDVLMELAGDSVDAEWLDELGSMVDYARSKGWVDVHGRLRAHVTIASEEMAVQPGSRTD